MADAARRTFTTYRETHPGERFYAYALYTDDDADGAIPAANTEEGLARVRQSYEARRERSESLGLPPTEPGHLRYVPDEWVYSGAEGNPEEWGAIWDRNERLGDVPDVCVAWTRWRSLRAMVRALSLLDADGFFGTGREREAVTLLVWITASADAERWWVRSIRRLNPRPVYERFLAERPSWSKARG